MGTTRYWRTLIVLLGVVFPGMLLAEDVPPHSPPNYVFLILIALMGIIVVMTIFSFLYMQRRILNNCTDPDCLKEYFELPFGVPIGTVRSVITFIIIAIGMMFFALKVFYGDVIDIPETLVNIIMAVIAFYFGTRSAARFPQRVSTKPATEPVHPEEKSRIRQALERARKMIDQVDEVKKILPEEQEKKVDELLDTAREYLDRAEKAEREGQYSVAGTVADMLENLLNKQNGLKDLLQNIVGTIGTIIGANPSLALVGGALRIGSTLAGDAYDRWRKRVLDMPIRVGEVNPNILDADTAESIFISIDLFKRSFQKELLSNQPEDKARLLGILKDLATGESMEELYQKYRDRIQGTPEEFSASVNLLREMLVDVEIDRSLRNFDFGELENYQNFIHYLNMLKDDKEGSVVLNELMRLIDKMREKNVDVHKILEYLRELKKQFKW